LAPWILLSLILSRGALIQGVEKRYSLQQKFCSVLQDKFEQQGDQANFLLGMR
jgi:hypothetical protein